MTQLERLQREGIRRVRTGKSGFRYVTAEGKPLPASERSRIDALRLPPAWQEVHIAPSARASLQAIGKDKAGRWQYRYHPRFSERQAARKYERLHEFAEALPRMRRTIDAHLRGRGLRHDRVMAALLKILANCFVRPGSAVYAEENGSFGLATLRRKHVKVRGDTVIFDFPGKSGKQQHRELKDRQVARVVRECLATPGYEVFKYITNDGAIVDVRRRAVNAYIKRVMGERFSAKDFRTWAGTLICACALARVGVKPDDSQRALRKKVSEAVKETARHLGNTPAICRSSYIYPSVLSSFARGQVIEKYFEDMGELSTHRTPTLTKPERALVSLLEKASTRSVCAVRV